MSQGVVKFDSNDADENPYNLVVFVPEPGLYTQLATGMLGLLVLGRFRSRARWVSL